MISTRQLRYFVEIADSGSFSAAAQELHRVPSAISYTVRQLEEWLAVPLFVRRHRDVELTPAGKLFIDEARGVMKKMLARLRVELNEHPQVLAIRGQGLMIGIELATPQRDLAQRAAQEHGLLINVTRGKIIRLLPPLTIDAKEVEMIVRALSRLLD